MTKLKGTYYNKEEFTYYSARYNKDVTIQEGEMSDGASGAFDINSKSWVVHDALKKYQVWDDGSECTNHQASYVVYDILKSEGRWFRARSWYYSTLIWGSFVEKKPLDRTKENLTKFN